MGYVFDGINKKIQLTSGTIFVDVVDMYSRWVDWYLTGDNSKYLPAMRVVGGDPISDIKNLGLTFFLINGWRIVPQSADHRLTLNGNLVTDPSGFSPIDTVPGYSIIVEYSVSNLVDSTLAQSPEIDGLVTSVNLLPTLSQIEASAILAKEATLNLVKAVTDRLPAGIARNKGKNNFAFLMVLSSDHITPALGKTVSAQKSVDGGAFISCDNGVFEVSNGIYKIDLSPSDTDGDVITYVFTAPGCDPRYITVITG